MKKMAVELERALEAKKEQEIHSFLEQNQVILTGIYGHNNPLLWSKYRLADAFVPDFLLLGYRAYSQDLRPTASFIEIERANERLFTKSGDPTSFLTHAIRQVQDWKRWVEANRGYLQSNLQRAIAETEMVSSRELEQMSETIMHGFSDRYFVIAGRRRDMGVAERVRLAQMSADLDRIRLMTYDALLEVLLSSEFRYDGDLYRF